MTVVPVPSRCMQANAHSEIIILFHFQLHFITIVISWLAMVLLFSLSYFYAIFFNSWMTISTFWMGFGYTLFAICQPSQRKTINENGMKCNSEFIDFIAGKSSEIRGNGKYLSHHNKRMIWACVQLYSISNQNKWCNERNYAHFKPN